MAVRDMKYGFGTHVEHLTRALQDLGVEVHLFIGQNDYVMTRLGQYLGNEYKNYDVLHVQGSPYLIVKQPIPTVVTVHTTVKTELMHDFWNFKFWMGRVAEELAMLSPDAFIAVNSCLVEDILGDVPNADITIIPNGIDSEEFDLRTVDKRIHILSGGRLIKRKRFGDVFVARDRSGCARSIVLFGDGKLFNRLVRISSFQKQGDRLLGWVEKDKLIWLYLSACMFVLSSSYETGPITILEAMAAHCPVISSDIPAVKGLVRHEETGLLYPVGDINKLSEQIKRLIEDQELGTKLVENAYEHVRKHHNWEDVAKATIGVYERVMEVG